MPLKLIRNDITKMQVDAIVNAANSTLLGGGGVDGAIHRAAGMGLLAECAKLGGCKVGEAKATKGYKLPCKYVIHTVGPRWKGGDQGEKALLEACYQNSLKLAKEYKCESVAFPLISSGVYGYPKDKALKVAMDVISDFLLENEMTVYIVIFDKEAHQISEKLFADITEYIDDHYVDAHTDYRREALRRNANFEESQVLPTAKMRTYSVPTPKRTELDREEASEENIAFSDVCLESTIDRCLAPTFAKESLEDIIIDIDESFSEMLLRKIDEKGMTDAECYKKANIDRKLFSKIRSDMNYKPSKPTAIAFAIALELPLAEAEDMLKKAGYALSHSNKFDLIIEYFIKRRNYNIFEINEALFAFDQSLLGS